MTGLLAFGSLVIIAFAGALFGVGAGLLVARAAGAKGGKVALFAVALAAGGLLVGLFAGIVNYSAVKKSEAEARRGWNLVPLVVAAVDIPQGETLTFDMISQRSIPEQFAPREAVRPDEVSRAVNQKTAAPLLAGDLLFWSALCVTEP